MRVFRSFRRLVRSVRIRILLPRVSIPRSVRVESPYCTLARCRELIEKRQTGAYLRFGDGDIFLMLGRDDLLQPSSRALVREMRETFELSGSGIVKSLPLESERFGYMPGMRPGTHLTSDTWAVRWLKLSLPYFIGTPIYSAVALHYVAEFDRDYAIGFLRFLRGQKPIFVGNEDVPDETVRKLFGSEYRVSAPRQNAYATIDEIDARLQGVLARSTRDHDVVVVALGCAGRVLSKRILSSTSRPIFLFDFGSLLDVLCGWNTRLWIEQSGRDAEYWSTLVEDVAGAGEP